LSASPVDDDSVWCPFFYGRAGQNHAAILRKHGVDTVHDFIAKPERVLYALSRVSTAEAAGKMLGLFRAMRVLKLNTGRPSDPAFNLSTILKSKRGAAWIYGRSWVRRKHEGTINGHDYGQRIGWIGAAHNPRYQFSVELEMRDGAYGTGNPRIDVRVTDDEVQIMQQVYLASKLGQHQTVAMKAWILASTRAFLDAKLSLVDRKTGRQRRLRVDIEFLDKRPRERSATVQLLPGFFAANTETLAFQSRSSSIAHEIAHRILATTDEYKDSKGMAPHRKLAQYPFGPSVFAHGKHGDLAPPSLMRCETEGVLLPRHARGISRLLRAVTGNAYAVTFGKLADGTMEKSADWQFE
jgi:hypothetical protein